MSSLAPVTAHLAKQFSPRQMIHFSSALFSLGHLLTSQAPHLSSFLAGRAITGIGAAGILAVGIVLALDLMGAKRRGLRIGLLNAAFSLGMSLGAVVAGGLMPRIGWVSPCRTSALWILQPVNARQRAVFSLQVLLTLLGATCLSFSIPQSFDCRKNDVITQTVLSRLLKIDYMGAATLVSLLAKALSSPLSSTQ